MAARAARKKPANRTSRCDEAYAVLKRRILTNELPAGEMIDDREIALELGMSRTPVREALLLLQREGFVEMAPRRGIRVLAISLEKMREIYEIISGLELMAVDLLAQCKPSRGDLAPLQDAVDDMRAATEAGDMKSWLDADERFHRGLFHLCGNSRLAELGLGYRDQIQRGHLVAMRLRPADLWETSLIAHQALLDILLTGDAKAARDAHYEQRVRAGTELIDNLNTFGLKNL